MATENKDQEPETASATLADGMHFVGNIEGFRMDLDAEESVGGVGAGPQPPRLLLQALAGCTAMDVISILRKKRQQVSGLSVEVQGSRADQHPRVYTRIEVLYRVRGQHVDPQAVARLTPQSIHVMGGYRVQGKRAEAAHELVTDAHALAAAGVFAIVLEGVPDVLAQIVTQEVPVPTIGIGAGPHCDGQVLVFHDVLGLYDGRVPKFVRPYAHLADVAAEALQGFFADVQAGTFPSDAESYHMDEESARTLRALMRNGE